MATILQVNANTQQAVGAFNNLASAIGNARGQFNQFHLTINQGNTVNRQYADGISRGMAGAFERLSGVLSSVYRGLTLVGTGLQFVFNSILKELDKLQGFNAIMSVTTKSSEGTASAYNYLRVTADRLGQQFDSLTGNYAKLVASLPEGNNRMAIAEKVFLGVAMAARTLHASNQDTQLMFYAISQMASKGAVSMEELRRQLGEKLPGTLQIAARALNTTPELLEKAIKTGAVNAAKFLSLFGDELIRTFANSSAKASESVSASINRLTNVWVDFVKVILDSGAGVAISGIFDAIREKLQDPYIIERFAQFIKYLAEQFTEFIKKLTTEDIRNGFDTFTKGVTVAVNVIGKLVEIFTWIINNGTKVGAIIGAAAGASIGIAAGPWGALAGGVIGGAAGAYAGNSVQPNAADYQARQAQDKAGKDAAIAMANEQSRIIQQYITPLLKTFNVTVDKVPGLFKAEALNMETVKKMVSLLNDPRFKTDASRQEALSILAKTGQVVGPNTSKLADVLGPGKPKKPSAEENRLESNKWRAYGFDGDFLKKWNDYNTLFKQGKLNTEQLEQAQKKLLEQQPFMEEAAKKQKKETEELNKQMEQNIDMAFRQVAVKEQVRRAMDDELRMAGMRSDEYEIEAKATQELNKLEDVGIDLRAQGREKELADLYTKIRLIRDTTKVTQAENSLMDQTVNRFEAQILQLKAIQKLKADPASGFTNSDAQNVVVRQSPELFSGSQLSIESQKAQWADLFSYIKALRAANVIDEATQNTLIAQQTELMSQRMRDAYVKVSQSRLELGNGTWADTALVSLGKITEGFTTFAAGASNSMGTFFTSFTDGFANSIGRAIVYSENLGDAIGAVAKEAVSSLISALVKLGIQWLVNAALGQAIAAGSAATALATTATVASATAVAWAPAAALASLASFGANAAPAMAGILATTAMSEGIALASMAGFQDGGYTGNGPKSGFAGVVHGQEFVMNAEATARNRPVLEAMNKGSTAKSARGGLNISFVNNGTPQVYEVEQLSESEVRVIARDEARQAVQTGSAKAVAADLANPNGDVSKAVKTHTTAQRRRGA